MSQSVKGECAWKWEIPVGQLVFPRWKNKVRLEELQEERHSKLGRSVMDWVAV